MVEVTDNNGCLNTYTAIVGFSDCTGFDEIEGLDEFSIFPNPNDGNFTLQLISSKPLIVDIKIFNASGSVFYSKESIILNKNYNKKIAIIDAKAGIYFLLLENNN